MQRKKLNRFWKRLRSKKKLRSRMPKRLQQMVKIIWKKKRKPEMMRMRNSLQMRKKNMQQERLQNLKRFSLLQ